MLVISFRSFKGPSERSPRDRHTLSLTGLDNGEEERRLEGRLLGFSSPFNHTSSYVVLFMFFTTE